MSATHDVTDRRRNNMAKACQALDNCRSDLLAFASNDVILPGVAYSVAERLGRLITELEAFKARDLINMREQAS